MPDLPKNAVPLAGLTQRGQVHQSSVSPEREHSNYTTLQRNRATVLDFTNEIIKDPSVAALDLDTQRSNIQDLVQAGKWSEAIIKLDELKDNRIGIVWRESGDLGVNGTRAIVRDARGVTTDVKALKKEQGEKYAMQILNQVRGGLALVEKSASSEEQKQEASDRLKYIAAKAMEDVDGLNSKSIKKFNTQIVHSLEVAGGIDEAAEKLVFAKEIGNLSDEHRHIVTLTSARDKEENIHTVVEADVMLNGLTDEQKKQYTAVSKSSKGVACGVEWFDKMEPYKQDLVRGVAVDIASGKKVLPTQFLKDLPGIKNAYEKTTAIRKQGQAKSKILVQSLHCGTPATRIGVFKDKGDLSKAVSKSKESGQDANDKKQEIATEDVRQLQTFVAQEDSVNLNILNAKLPAGKGVGENFVFHQMHKAKEEIGNKVSVTESSINRGRWIGGRETSQFQKELADIAQALSQGDRAVFTEGAAAFFGKNGSKNAVKEAIDKQRDSNPELAAVLDLMVRAQDLAASGTITADTSNISLDLTAKMNIIRSSAQLQDGALHKVFADAGIEAPNVPVTVDFCKSGKDRTGYVKSAETNEAVNTELGLDPESDLGKKNLLSQVAGNHTQEMAGVQGGSIGCHGIKLNKFTFGLTGRDHSVIKDIIDQKSANFNATIKLFKSKIPGVAKVKKKAITKTFDGEFENHQTNEIIPQEVRGAQSGGIQGQQFSSTQSGATGSQIAGSQPTAAVHGQAQQRAPAPAQQKIMYALYSDIITEQKIHAKALGEFKRQQVLHDDGRITIDQLQSAIEVYSPQLERFKEAVDQFEQQQQAMGTALGQRKPQSRGVSDPGATLSRFVVSTPSAKEPTPTTQQDAMQVFAAATKVNKTSPAMSLADAAKAMGKGMKLSEDQRKSSAQSTPGQKTGPETGRGQ